MLKKLLTGVTMLFGVLVWMGLVYYAAIETKNKILFESEDWDQFMFGGEKMDFVGVCVVDDSETKRDDMMRTAFQLCPDAEVRALYGRYIGSVQYDVMGEFGNDIARLLSKDDK